MLEWGIIKNKLYYLDGSLRDILVFNMHNEEWYKWINYVNIMHKVKFKNYYNEVCLDYIDYNLLKSIWGNDGESVHYYALINLGKVIVNCYFNSSDSLDQDISPIQIKSILEHEELVKYLQDISFLLNKEVYFTEEMNENAILMKVKKDKVDVR